MKKSDFCCCVTFSASLLLSATAFSQAKPVYQTETAPIDARVQDLITRMTLEEKVLQLESMMQLPGMPSIASSIINGGQVDPATAKQMIGDGMGTIMFAGDAGIKMETPRTDAVDRNAIQKWVMTNTRLGIPILFHGEALHGSAAVGATSFPQAIGLGSTWDPTLLKTMFESVGMEARAVGVPLVLAPVLDLSRDPRYGRVEEMYSEDPYLVSKMGVAAITGLQGDKETFDQNHVIATAKHFVHGQPENGTNVGPSDFSERTMRDIFLVPFQQAVEVAHIGAVMPSYNENDGGIPSNSNPWLLRQVLRKEWGFDGLTISDYFAVEQLTTLQHVAADKAAAGILALNSGVDMELPAPSGFPALVEGVKSGKVAQAQLDEAVARVLRMKFRAGLFDHPYVDPDRAQQVVGSKEHGQLARKVADEAIVLLKNQGNVLPLNPQGIGTLAVIGPNADKARLGTYSGMPPYFVTALEGIRKRVGSTTRVVYAEGCRISEPDSSVMTNAMMPYQAPQEAKDKQLIAQAVDTARSADVVVLVLGGNESVSRESFGDTGGLVPTSYGDSDSLELPGRQNELVNEILKLGKPVVAVLLNGKPYSINLLAQQVPAILEGWYLGQETGNAVAGVLFGDVNPSGHLPVTIARNVGQLPVFYYKTPAARRGYVFEENTPLFPFGFGLSYTTFTVDTPTLDRNNISPAQKAIVSVKVTNTGTRAGDEVVQMYVHHAVSSVVQPVIALRGFQRVHLAAGESTTVNFEAGPEQLAILNKEMKREVEPGAVDILIGRSSADTRSVQLTVAP